MRGEEREDSVSGLILKLCPFFRFHLFFTLNVSQLSNHNRENKGNQHFLNTIKSQYFHAWGLLLAVEI